MAFLKIRLRRAIMFAAILVSMIIALLAIFMPDSASPEYAYTIHCLVSFALPPCILLAIVLLIAGGSFKNIGNQLFGIAFLLISATLAAFIYFGGGQIFSPAIREIILSICWIICLLCASFFLFIMGAASRPFLAAILCAAGSIFLALTAGEAFLLATPQPQDGMHFDDASSKYVSSGETEPGHFNTGNTVCGRTAIGLGKPAASAHRSMRYGEEIYDVRYDFDASGRRITPRADARPEFDLLLFGCSFTFGWGLQNEQTWAWQLAQSLGPAWRVINYAFNGYSANQMLCMLENQLIEMPSAPHRYALFLAINDHLRRNEHYANFPHYMLANNTAARGGTGKYLWLSRIPQYFPGSQLARQISSTGTGIALAANQKEYELLYAAMIIKSGQLLQNKYGTELIVMLWPDMEQLAPELKEAGMRVIMARGLLPGWDANPGQYHISKYDGHPNALAAQKLAGGLNKYFLRLGKE